jgi:ElaB/YqjD/DUF883 family membrane-anchored ribosome-binding protein
LDAHLGKKNTHILPITTHFLQHKLLTISILHVYLEGMIFLSVYVLMSESKNRIDFIKNLSNTKKISIMTSTKEELLKEAAQHKAETIEKKVDVAKAELQEKTDEAKIGAADLAEKAQDKWGDLKEGIKDTWEKAKDKAEDIGDKIADKAQEIKKDIKDKLD